tara:strand:+ start:7793 stop:7912 length:120 start_codon:yes stop_codon:yes gene_type:complete
MFKKKKNKNFLLDNIAQSVILLRRDTDSLTYSKNTMEDI